MRRLVGAVAGFVVGGAAVLMIGLALPKVVTISQMEGAYAMGLVFFWVPLGAVVGAVAGLIIAGRRG